MRSPLAIPASIWRAAPARIIRQQPGRETRADPHPGAAGGLEAIVGAEEFLVVGVVHVDRMRIGHVDAHRAERIPRAGILPDGEIGRAIGIPVDACGSTSWPAPSSTRMRMRARSPDPCAFRDDILLQDAERHRPGRIEIDGRDVGGERRRRTIGPADLHHMAAHDLVAFDRLGEGRREDYHDVALAEGKSIAASRSSEAASWRSRCVTGTLSAVSVFGPTLPVSSSP